MANLIRSSKPASEWTQHDLMAYHIQVVEEDELAFFGLEEHHLPPPEIADNFINFINAAAARAAGQQLGQSISRLFHQMGRAMVGNEAAVDNFSRSLFESTAYDNPTPQEVNIEVQYDLRFFVSGGIRSARPNLAIVNNGFIRIVQENKSLKRRNSDPEPQMIAQAIAAFRYNNLRREEPLPHETILGITMVGTTPTFYQIRVTTELLDAVSYGQFPDEETRVRVYTPAVGLAHGMLLLDNRSSILFELCSI